MNAIKFGKFLASLRSEKKLTQEELAEKLFIDKRKVSRWECGMSIPDFETIIKLSEILDVTPYEFSICKRLDKEKLSKKAINKFKNIKDFKNYKLKKKILIILTILLGIFFIFTTIYTFKFYGEVEIYEFVSLDEKYTLNGIYIQTNNYVIYNISNVELVNGKSQTKLLNNCEFEIYYNNIRLISLTKKDKKPNKEITKDLQLFYYGQISIRQYTTKKLVLNTICLNNNQTENHFINFALVKKYDNKLF